jgi:ferredoxin-like protein FixX
MRYSIFLPVLYQRKNVMTRSIPVVELEPRYGTYATKPDLSVRYSDCLELYICRTLVGKKCQQVFQAPTPPES